MKYWKSMEILKTEIMKFMSRIISDNQISSNM